MKSFFLYILRCGDGSLYVGQTNDLDRRLAQHRSGDPQGFTSLRHPLKLVHVEEFPTRREAFERERQIKGWTKAKKEALIAGDWERVKKLARGPDREH